MAGQLTATTTATIDYPAHVDLTPQMSVQVDGRRFDIVHILEQSDGHKSENSALVARTG